MNDDDDDHRDNYMCRKVDNIIIQHFLTHVFIRRDINIIQMIIIIMINYF